MVICSNLKIGRASITSTDISDSGVPPIYVFCDYIKFKNPWLYGMKRVTKGMELVYTALVSGRELVLVR